jgi:hypothetical protein
MDPLLLSPEKTFVAYDGRAKATPIRKEENNDPLFTATLMRPPPMQGGRLSLAIADGRETPILDEKNHPFVRNMQSIAPKHLPKGTTWAAGNKNASRGSVMSSTATDRPKADKPWAFNESLNH